MSLMLFPNVFKRVSLTALLVMFMLAAGAACGGPAAPEDSGTSSVGTSSSATGTEGPANASEPQSPRVSSPAAPTPRPDEPEADAAEQSRSQPAARNPGSMAAAPASAGQTGASGPGTGSPAAPDPTPSPTPAPPPGERDRAALIAFYHATGGDNWKLNRRWLSEEPLDQWQGVTASQEGGVTKLLLPDNRLTGEIPPEFANLLDLTELDLSANQLSGCIPVALYYDGALGRANVEPLTACPEPDRENLVAVFRAMGMQEHQGAIGTWPGIQLDQSGYVKTLDLWPRTLRQAPEGVPVVPELARLSKLQALRMRGIGELAPELGKLSNLEFLSIRGDELTGEIPPELGDLSNLTYLQFSESKLSGEIPAELGQLSNLTFLHLQGNQLSGTIPAGLGHLPNLISARVENNPLSGCLPKDWAVVARPGTEDLPICSAASGRISQEEADREFRALAALFEDAGGAEWKHDVKRNWLSDKPPGEWGGVRTDDNGYVVSITLFEANGNLPAELGDLMYLRTLYILSPSALTGGIPKELGNLPHLTYLIVDGLSEPGSIPPELSNLSRLRLLGLTGNQLTGQIPPELGNLSDLRFLNLSINQLSGPVPAELGNLTRLQSLFLYSNQLTGEMPQEVWNLPDMNRLELDPEQGCVPAELRDRLYTVYRSYSKLRFC